MACNGYKPRFQDQINGTDPLGSFNCTCYSAAMAGDYHTCGSKVPTGKRVRELTGDRSGGTTLPQVDYALRKGWNIDLDTRIGSSRLTWAQFVAKLNAGRGAVVQGSYKVIHGTRFQGDTRFTGNHAVYVNAGLGSTGFVVMDPLCDGRKAGVYKYHGEKYPADLIKRFAGALEVVPGRRLGLGLVWCSLTRDNTAVYKARVYPKPPATRKMFYRYLIKDGIIVGREKRYTTGFTHTVTAPRIYRAKSGLGYTSKSLVKLLTGTTRKGWYISSTYADEV